MDRVGICIWVGGSCGVRDGVLLGDRSYGEFCSDGEVFFALLEASLGARSGNELSSRSSYTDQV